MNAKLVALVCAVAFALLLVVSMESRSVVQVEDAMKSRSSLIGENVKQVHGHRVSMIKRLRMTETEDKGDEEEEEHEHDEDDDDDDEKDLKKEKSSSSSSSSEEEKHDSKSDADEEKDKGKGKKNSEDKKRGKSDKNRKHTDKKEDHKDKEEKSEDQEISKEAKKKDEKTKIPKNESCSCHSKGHHHLKHNHSMDHHPHNHHHNHREHKLLSQNESIQQLTEAVSKAIRQGIDLRNVTGNVNLIVALAGYGGSISVNGVVIKPENANSDVKVFAGLVENTEAKNDSNVTAANSTAATAAAVTIVTPVITSPAIWDQANTTFSNLKTLEKEDDSDNEENKEKDEEDEKESLTTAKTATITSNEIVSVNATRIEAIFTNKTTDVDDK